MNPQSNSKATRSLGENIGRGLETDYIDRETLEDIPKTAMLNALVRLPVKYSNMGQN